MKPLILLVLLYAAPVTGHHTALPDGMNGPEAAWLWGFHAVPAVATKEGSPYWYGYPHDEVGRINNPPWTAVAATHLQPGVSIPAVLIIHGCLGIARGPTTYRISLLKKGFAVFEPDSYARPGHSCTKGESALNVRTEDLYHALEQIQELDWVDSKRIVLMGISQGGAAVSRWSKPGVQAHIIVGDDCMGRRPSAPENTPVLAIAGGEDELLNGFSCKVTRTLGGSGSIVIPGAPHAVSEMQETIEAIEEFLETCCR